MSDKDIPDIVKMSINGNEAYFHKSEFDAFQKFLEEQRVSFFKNQCYEFKPIDVVIDRFSGTLSDKEIIELTDTLNKLQ